MEHVEIWGIKMNWFSIVQAFVGSILFVIVFGAAGGFIVLYCPRKFAVWIWGLIFGLTAIFVFNNKIGVGNHLFFDFTYLIMFLSGYWGGWMTVLVTGLIAGGYGLGQETLSSYEFILMFLFGLGGTVLRKFYPEIKKWPPGLWLGFTVIQAIVLLQIRWDNYRQMGPAQISYVILLIFLGFYLSLKFFFYVQEKLCRVVFLDESLKKSNLYLAVFDDRGRPLFLSENLKENNSVKEAVKEQLFPETGNFPLEIHRRGMHINRELNILTVEGKRTLSLDAQATALPRGDMGVMAVLFDITERKQIERDDLYLERVNLVGEMAVGIAHEIRNPMTTIAGFLQFLKTKPEFKGYQNNFELMLEEIKRINLIINDFLACARHKPVDFKVQNLNAIVAAVAPLIQVEAVFSNKYLKVELGDIPDLTLDENEIRELIFNLARNGLEAMEAGGNLTIKTFRDEGEVVLVIQDEGPGMAPEIMEKLGTPFLTTKDGRTGLGLALCYSIAGRHNATIRVETSASGTIFYVRFPFNGSYKFS
jgi:signal transduction histidine kinase